MKLFFSQFLPSSVPVVPQTVVTNSQDTVSGCVIVFLLTQYYIVSGY